MFYKNPEPKAVQSSADAYSILNRPGKSGRDQRKIPENVLGKTVKMRRYSTFLL